MIVSSIVLASVTSQPVDGGANWWLEVAKAAAFMLIGAAASYLKLHRRIVLMRAEEEKDHREREGELQRQLRERDAELEALKKERKIKNTAQAERLEQHKELTSLAILHK